MLNLKKIKFAAHDHEVRNLNISVNKEGTITAGDIQSTAQCEVLNPTQIICTVDKKQKFEAACAKLRDRYFIFFSATRRTQGLTSGKDFA